jgi:serine/threonine-protein kinase
MMTDLELYLYSDRYGPTNEKLAVYIQEIYVQENSSRPPTPPPPPLRPPAATTLESQW